MPGFDQLLDDRFVRHFVEMGKMIDLHHREGFQMKLRILLLKRRQQICEVAERQLRVQPADDVQFRRAFLTASPAILSDSSILCV